MPLDFNFLLDDLAEPGVSPCSTRSSTWIFNSLE